MINIFPILEMFKDFWERFRLLFMTKLSVYFIFILLSTLYLNYCYCVDMLSNFVLCLCTSIGTVPPVNASHFQQLHSIWESGLRWMQVLSFDDVVCWTRLSGFLYFICSHSSSACKYSIKLKITPCAKVV